MFFFFKQKTAYEMLISDWSSDVCSSDLAVMPRGPAVERIRPNTELAGKRVFRHGRDQRQRDENPAKRLPAVEPLRQRQPQRVLFLLRAHVGVVRDERHALSHHQLVSARHDGVQLQDGPAEYLIDGAVVILRPGDRKGDVWGKRG